MNPQNSNSIAQTNQSRNLQQLQESRNQLNKIEQESFERQTQYENTSLQKDIRNLKEQISELETKRSEQEVILEDAQRSEQTLLVLSVFSRSPENKKKFEEAKKKRQEAETELKNLKPKINSSKQQLNQKLIEAAPSQLALDNSLKNNNDQAENIKKNIGRLETVLKQTGNELAKENIEKYNNYNTSLINRLNEQNNKKMPESDRRKNYITVNRFYIEIESEVRASFTECSGLGVNLKKETYLEGGVNNQQRIILGHAEFTDVTLKRGMTDDLVFWGWISSALTGRPSSRRNVNILLFNQAGETMMCWTLIGAIPISWKAPGFQADGNSVAIEELTLAYEGLQVKTAQGSGGATVGIGRDGLGFFPSN